MESRLPPAYLTTSFPKYDGIVGPHADNVAVERLRVFITQHLCNEYGLEGRVRIVQDWRHWMHLSMLLIRKLDKVLARSALTADACKDEEYINFHVERPAHALGVPPELVRAMLRLLPLSLDCYGRCQSMIWRYFICDDGCLATKILVDRDIIIDAVVQDQALNARLKQANQEFQAQWFERLESPDDWVLSEHGKRCEKHWKEAKRRARNNEEPVKPILPWLERFRGWILGGGR